MKDILALLISPVFWFSTVFLALVLSIVGNLATDGVKQFWGRYSARQRERNEKRHKRITAEAEKCIDDLHYLVLDNAALNDQLVRSILWLLMVAFTSAAGLGFVFFSVDFRNVAESLEAGFFTSVRQLSVVNVILTTPPSQARFWYGIIAYLFLFFAVWVLREFSIAFNAAMFWLAVFRTTRKMRDKQREAMQNISNLTE